MIGDTDFFIDLMDPRKALHARALEKVRELEGQPVRIAMTAVTRFELHSEVHQAKQPDDERERVLRAIRNHPTYAFDGDAADRAGALYGSLRVAGTPIGIADAMIAAISPEHRERLLTRKRKDFGLV